MKYKKENQIIEIDYDSDLLNPLDFDCNIGTVALIRNNNISGDETVSEKPEADYILPVYMLDHSGLKVNTTGFDCPWDSGQIGWIYTTKDKLKELGVSESGVINILEAEIRIWSQYLEGDVYFYTKYELKKCDCCQHVEKEIVDSCGGFYGQNFKENGLFEQAGIDDTWQEKE